MTREIIKDKIMSVIFLICAVFAVLALIIICVYIFASGIPAIAEIGLFKFLFGTRWSPNAGDYGILPMILGSIYVTIGAIIIGVSIGLFTAVFISKFCGKRMKKVLSTIVNLLAGIPSILYGFFGLIVIEPLLRGLSIYNSGMGIFAASLVLGIMILPTIVSISVSSINAVEKNYYEGARALGANHEQAVFKVIVPSAKSGIFAGVILGLGRAIGETMAVIMVAGNNPVFVKGIVESIRTMTGNIVLEMSYSTGLHRGALIGTGTVLFIFILILNSLIMKIKSGKKENNRSSFKQLISRYNPFNKNISIKYCRVKCGILKYSSYLSSFITVSLLLMVIGFILIKGLPYVTYDLIFSKFQYGGNVTLLPSLVTTGMLIGISLIIAVPLGVFSAVYLTEYVKKQNAFTQIINASIETLAGIPSIIYGLFGMLFFVVTLKWGFSIIAGAFTLVIMVLPIIIKSCEESLKAVPFGYREGSFALGAGKVRTIFKIVLPSCISGIIVAVVLSIGRIVGESAALIFTAGSMPNMPEGITSGGSSLAVMMYTLAVEGLHMNEAYATAVVLLFIVLIINSIATLLDTRLKKEQE